MKLSFLKGKYPNRDVEAWFDTTDTKASLVYSYIKDDETKTAALLWLNKEQLAEFKKAVAAIELKKAPAAAPAAKKAAPAESEELAELISKLKDFLK